MTYRKLKKSSLKKTSPLALLKKIKIKNWKKGIGMILASVMLITSIQPAYARIIFKGEFLIEDDGTNTWVIDAGDDVTGDVSVQFGTTLGQTITYNTTDTWFEFSDDLAIGGNTFTLDADNTGTGSNVEIIANQGTDNDGVLRYNAVTNQWEISNDGGTYIALGVQAGSGSLETFDVGSITSQSMNVFQNTATWGGMIIPTTDVEIDALLAWVTQTATGNVQGAIYNASTNAQLATTGTASSATLGIKTLSFASPVALTQGTPYYLAISCTGNGSLFAGRNATGFFNNPPFPSFIQNGSRLPATLTPGFNNNLVWIGTLIHGSINSGSTGGGTGDFEDVYATDADNTLTTGNGDFTVNTGTGDFIVNSAYWDINNAGDISTEGLIDIQNHLQLDVESIGGSSNWYNTSWNSRKQITINASQVSGAGSHTNFPVLINLTTDSDLAAAAQTDADDILFTASDGTTKLDHEIGSYNSGTGQLTAWVRIPSLSTSTNTNIYMYYENGSAANQENVTGVWDANYNGVWHLDETTGAYQDSTSNNQDSTTAVPNSRTSNGITGYAPYFTNTTDYVNLPDVVNNGTFTVELWLNPDWNGNDNAPHAWLDLTNDPLYFFMAKSADNNMHFAFESANDADVDVTYGISSAVTSGNWYYQVGTGEFNGSNHEMYLNGSQVGTVNFAINGKGTMSGNVRLGSPGSTYFLPQGPADASVDEIRISSIKRSVDWISTTYNNMSAPGSFHSLSTEENLSLGNSTGNIGTITNSDLNLYTNNESKLNIDSSNTETIITLDADNTSAGKNATIIANQGTDNDGTIRYNASTNQWEYSNDGGTFQPFGSGGGSSDFEGVYSTDGDNTLTTGNGDFTVDSGTGDTIITSNDWGVDASGNITTSGTVDGYDISVIGAQAHDQNTDIGSTSAAFELDSDNAGAGANVEIIANQGTDNDGILRYNATSNQWEYSNDGGTFQSFVAAGGSDDFESVFATDSDNTLTTANTTFTINTGTGDFVITSNDWGIDASGNLTISGTVDGYDVSVIGAQAHDQNTDVSTTNTAFELDADNAGTGANVEIIANQGTDNDGILRYNASTNEWEYSNDGGAFQSFGSGGGSDDFESVFATDSDNTLTTANTTFTINTGTGDFVITSNDWGIDASGNLTISGTVDGYDVSVIGAQAHDQNTDVSTTSAAFTLDADNAGAGTNVEIVAEQGTDNNGVLRYNATTNQWEISNDGGAFVAIATGGHTQNTDTGTTSNTFTLDTDDTGGNVTWQFGTTLAETFTWDNTDLQFELSDDLFIDGNLGIGANAETNIDLYIEDTDPTLMLSNGTASTGNRLRFDFGSVSAGGWYSSSWSARKPITINASQVNGTGSYTDFPVLINLTSDSGLAASAQTDGDDILFTSSDGMTKLDHEIEAYTTGTGALRAWVEIPSLSTSADTTIYMYYGNSGAANQQNVNGVWSNNYAAVYHMDATGSNETDSTANANNATFGGTMPNIVTGQIGNAHDFNGTSDYAEAVDSASLDITSAITISAWINPDTIDDWERIIAKSHTSDVAPWTYYGLLFDDTDHVRMEITSGGTQYSTNGTNVISTAGGWYYGTVTFNGTTLTAYLNGVQNGTTSYTGTIDTNNMPLSLGRSGYGNNYYDGQIDEARISSVARSATWISTEYNNQNTPASFYSVGAAEAETFITTANIGTVDDSGLNLYTNNTSKLTIDGGSGTTITLDADNASTGNTATIIANQGSDIDGGLRYNATTNRWEISNDGGAYQAIATNPPSLYHFIDTTADSTSNTDATNYWDEGAQNGNQHPNITPSSTTSEVLVMATISFDPLGVDDTSVVARIERNIGSDPVCGSGTQVGDEFGWMTSDDDIDGASVIYMDSPATTSQVFYTVCSDSDTTDAVGLIQQIQFTLYEINNAADIAEIYATNDDSITSGDIVSFDPELTAGVKKSEKAYDQKVMGVVSTQPAKLIGGTDGEGKRGVPIALSGRVPVKVSTENGDIKPGDLLTASSIPGVAMKATKAGYIIGRAFGEYAEKGIGLILGFIGTHYADPENLNQ